MPPHTHSVFAQNVICMFMLINIVDELEHFASPLYHLLLLNSSYIHISLVLFFFFGSMVSSLKRLMYYQATFHSTYIFCCVDIVSNALAEINETTVCILYLNSKHFQPVFMMHLHTTDYPLSSIYNNSKYSKYNRHKSITTLL